MANVPPMMKCGHQANAVDSKGAPSCVICAGLVAGAEEIDDAPPSLKGRHAKCTCGRTVLSDKEERDAAAAAKGGRFAWSILPFFEHRPQYEFDSYYCGHAGWD